MKRIDRPPCPQCPEQLVSVIETSGRADGTVRRRRECPNGHRATTWEVLAPEPPRDRLEGIVAALMTIGDDVRAYLETMDAV